MAYFVNDDYFSVLEEKTAMNWEYE